MALFKVANNKQFIVFIAKPKSVLQLKWLRQAIYGVKNEDFKQKCSEIFLHAWIKEMKNWPQKSTNALNLAC